ncbi:hypothetical protein [Halocynthiibacter sp.]|uniref:hypothetical protein n=1 Tax=Halocynthiibacter sp. TaxID=1979210 RepID=UPI003C622055
MLILFPIALLLSLLLRNVRAWQILSFIVFGLILSVASAFALITRSTEISSWLMLLLMALPLLFHISSLTRPSPFTGYLSLLWIPAGIGLMLLVVSSMSLLSLRSYTPHPLESLALTWIFTGAILPLIPRAAWPGTEIGWTRVGLVFLGIQITAVLSTFALSALISYRAQQIAGDNACITDTAGARYHSRLWISPARMMQNHQRGVTLPWLVLDSGEEYPTHHWSFYALDFLPNDHHVAFDMAFRFYQASESEITC